MEISITDLLIKPGHRLDPPKGTAASAVALNDLLGQFSNMMGQATKNSDGFARPSTREPIPESRTDTRETGATVAGTVRDDTARRADAARSDDRPAPTDTPPARETDTDDGAPHSAGDNTPPEHAGTDADRYADRYKDAPNATAEGAKSGTDIPGHDAAENAAGGLEIAAEVSAAITPAGILDVPGKAAGLDLMAISQPGANANLNSGTALSTAPLATPGAGSDTPTGAAIANAATNGSPSLPGNNPALEAVTNAPRADAADKGMSAALASLANLTANAKGAGAAEQALGALTVPANAKSALVDGPGQAPIAITVTQETPRPVSKPSAMLLATSLAADNTAVPAATTQAGGTPQTTGQPGGDASTVGQTASDATAIANNGATSQIPSGAATAGMNANAAASYGIAQSTANTGALTMDSPLTVAPIGGMGPAQASPAQALAAATRPTPVAQPVAEQLAVHIVKAAADGMDKISIKLRPAALGHIEVQLELSHDGRITAVVTAEKSETLDLLQRDARGLERALQEAGLKTNSDSLNFNLRGEDREAGQDASDHAARGDGIQVAIETLDDNIHTAQMGGYANARAALGGVDIRV